MMVAKADANTENSNHEDHKIGSNEKNVNNDDEESPLQRFSTTTRRNILVRQFTRNTVIHNMEEEPIEAAKVDPKSIGCGLAAGMVQAALFSPYDRALYLSMTNQTPFLSIDNFRNPFAGLSQSIGGRALSGGLYFPLEQFFFQLFHSPTDGNSKVRNFASGTCAGALNAMILNPLSAIKYKTWSRMYNRGMWEEASSMFRKGGKGVFYRGLSSTLCRDVAFGGVYTCIRLQLQWAWSIPHEHQWIANLIAAALATIVSGPFNLARNMQYSAKSSLAAPTTTEVLQELSQQTHNLPSLRQKTAHLQKRLRIGWGTARVATGMAFGHWVYDGLHGLAHDHDESWVSQQQRI